VEAPKVLFIIKPDININGANPVINKLKRQLVKNETVNPPTMEQSAEETSPNWEPVA
jgi:hypothetical protein